MFSTGLAVAIVLCTAHQAQAQAAEGASGLSASEVAGDSPGMGLRVGFGLSGGAAVSADDNGVGGFYLQLGIELNSWFAVYIQSDALGGATLGDEFGEAFFLSWNQLQFELSAWGWLSLAAGPSLDYRNGCSASAQTLSAGCEEGTSLGLHARLGAALGPALFSINLHRMTGSSANTYLLGGLGFQF